MMTQRNGEWKVWERHEHARQSAAVNGFAGAMKAMGKTETDVLALLAEARATAGDGRHDGARVLFARMRDIEVREMLAYNESVGKAVARA